MTTTPQPPAIMDVTLEFPVIMNVAPEATKAVLRRLRLASSLADTPLMSVQAAGIPVVVSSLGVSEVLPPSIALVLR